MSAAPQRKLFGTDGVRGPVGELLDADLALALGRAAATEAGRERPRMLIVRDTRESGPMLEAAFAAGVASVGGDVYRAGVLPSAAASVLVRRYGFDLAAVISASHNPWRDNGIKLFGSAGVKLDDESEARIEERLEAPKDSIAGDGTGRIRTLEGALDDYLRELAVAFELDLSGRRVLLDCANGAAYRAAPLAFARLGAAVEAIADEPDGRNINEGCGSTHVENLVEALAGSEAELGFAFDGDADRVLAVDREGQVRDGDELIALIALHLREIAGLEGTAVTVMTNFGFARAMADAGIEVATTQVGDRYVIEELLRRGWTLGGEQSGHVIWTEFAPCGDGIAAALLTMRALAGRDFAEVRPFDRLPQRRENVPIPDREALDGALGLWEAVEREQAALDGRGRVLVRPSGTEPLVRLMVEAPDEAECDAVLGRLVSAAHQALGS
jgi:phosphoglucosamine mutase